MYHNIIFDMGGVVIDYNPKDYLAERFYHERTERSIYDAVFGSEEWKLMDEGKMSWSDASQIFMQRGIRKNIAFEMRAVLEEWPEMMTTRRATVTLMRVLKKKGFELYYLTNVASEVLEFWKKRKFWSLFEGGVASCEVGTSKPSLDIYKTLLGNYRLTPQECIFIDDTKANASAAFEVGITGIQFRNVKNLCKMLVTYGIEL